MTSRLLGKDQQHSLSNGIPSLVNAYSPYGVMAVAAVHGLAFCGQYRDPHTGNYPLGNGRRFYSPTLMRFTTCDSLSPFSRGGINGYAYCGGDPVNRHDPSGAFWSALLRTIGVMSSGATLFGSLARTAQNVVKRRAAFRDAGNTGGMESGDSHSELPHFSRVANQQLFITGGTGTAGQLVAAISGVAPAFQTATDVLSAINAGTNLSGGSIGNYGAARDVVNYMRQYPKEIPGVALETVMDVTMLDEMLSSVGRGFTYVGRGFAAAAAKIRSWRTGTYEVTE